MPRKLRLILIVFSLLTFVSFASAHIILNALSSKENFKTLAEQKVSEFLQANVKINRVKVGLLNNIAFSGLAVDPDDTSANPFQFKVDKIVFKYDLMRLLMRNLENPAAILLKAPKLMIAQGSTFPYEVLQDLDFGAGAASVATLKVEGGQIRYVLHRFASEISLTNVNGVFKPIGIGKIRADFKATASGFLEGEVRIVGDIDPIKRSHQLKIYLDSATLSEKLNLPIEAMFGSVRWVDGDLFFDPIHAKVHGWETTIRGSLKGMDADYFPALILDLDIGKGAPLAQVSLKADMATHVLQGAFRPLEGEAFTFEGKVFQEGSVFSFKDLLLANGYAGVGKLDGVSGDYQFKFKKERREIVSSSNLRNLNLNLQIKLDHIDFYGLDLVTFARIEILEKKPNANGVKTEFSGKFETDYFILEQAPFDDFEGQFSVNATGIHDIMSTWGESFRLEGNVFFKPGGPEARLFLRVADYELENVKEFAARPLPKKIGGKLDGKLIIQGPLKKPEVLGDFTIKKGLLGKLEYDRGFLHFRGFMPYLSLYDSHIDRGRTKLFLKGAIDFSLDNPLHGFFIQSADKIVLYKGWEINTSEAEGDFEINTALGKFPKLSVKAGVEGGDASNKADATQDENYIAVASKIAF